MKLTLIGDIHGEFKTYFSIVNNLSNKSIQLGDMGIGFPDTPETLNTIFPIENKHKFIRGNHDNPFVCRNHEHYLGDYGLTNDGIFFISGAWSIDRQWRTLGKDWWYEEELSVIDFDKCLELYETHKPEIVISHGCPMEVQKFTTLESSYQSRTALYMSEMIKIHKPKEWIFGHMHSDWQGEVEGINFVCVNQLTTYTIEI